MASLRKKPDVVSASDTAPAAISVDASTSPPVPELTSPETDASAVLKKQIDALAQAGNLHQQAQAAMLAAQERRQAWVKSNPLAQQHYEALNQLHGAALQSGLADSSPAYFDFLNNCLGTLDAQQPATAAMHLAKELQQRAAQSRPPEPPQPKPVSHGSIVSAPVSREIPSANGSRQGRITLTREHLEAAKIAGITPTEYAKQLMKLHEMQAAGEYSERR